MFKKKLLLILCIVFIGCSTEDVPIKEVEERDYKIYVLNECPDHTSMIRYFVSKETHSEVLNEVKKHTTYCVAISFEDLKGNLRAGYYGGASPANN